MVWLSTQTYCPELRLKTGEGDALLSLAPSLAPRLLPHFVVPPARDRDPERQSLFSRDLPRIYGRKVGQVWPERPCLLDPRFLFSQLGKDEAKKWLPEMLEFTLSTNANAAIVASLQNLEGPERFGFDAALRVEPKLLALRVTFSDLARADVAHRIRHALSALPIKIERCILIMDFSDAELSRHDAAADVVAGFYLKVIEIGPWCRVVWQATSYPDKNPAMPGQLVTLPRHEWAIWLRLVATHPDLVKSLMFGDFGADCARFNFDIARAAAIPHFRHSTTDSWLVSRGPNSRTVAEAIRMAASRIVDSESFVGEFFSAGDKFLVDVADRLAGPGKSSMWRSVNTVHHLTRVMRDLARILGHEIPEIASAPGPRQSSFLDSPSTRGEK